MRPYNGETFQTSTKNKRQIKRPKITRSRGDDLKNLPTGTTVKTLGLHLGFRCITVCYIAVRISN